MQALQRYCAVTERYQLLGQVLYLYAPDGIGRSRLAANMESCLGIPATGRNFSTVMALLRTLQEHHPRMSDSLLADSSGSLDDRYPRIEELRGLGPRSQAMLAAIGIHDRADLERVGVLDAYIQVRDRTCFSPGMKSTVRDDRCAGEPALAGRGPSGSPFTGNGR